MSRLRKWGLTVLTMVSVATVVLLVTGWGSAAASSMLNVFVTNDSNHPVPVRPQAVAPVTDGGEVFAGACQDEQHLDSPVIATALSIHMSSGVTFVNLQMNGATSSPTSPVIFAGPAEGGNSEVTLALTRPIEFDTINCVHDSTTDNTVSVSWVGNKP